ncbi:MAG TPA: hypothetical protein VLX68_03040 [Chitinivibrionales bacterium]|nr:hypothetical protein [Chitinivibrionales bacterium]
MIKKVFLLCSALAVAALMFSGCSPTKSNHPPTGISLSNTTLVEGAASNTAVGIFSTQDPDAGNVFTYSLVSGVGAADNASFIIRNDSLLAAVSFDYNVTKTCSIRVRTKDQNQASFDTTFIIAILHINHAPTALAFVSAGIRDNAAVGSLTGTFSVTDSDAADHHTFMLAMGTGSDDNASFTVSGDSLLTAVAFNATVKASYTVRIKALDDSGAAVEQAFTITVAHVNHAPSAVLLSNASVLDTAAAGAFVGKLSATDADVGDQFTYSLAAGAGAGDNASFIIRKDSLLVNAPLDAKVKAAYAIRVRARDDSGATVDSALTVTIVHRPTDILISDTSVLENSAAGTTVGILHAVDRDSASETYQFTLVGGDTALFAIAWGALNTKSPIAYDSLKNTFSVVVKVTDSYGGFFQKTFTISIKKIIVIDGVVIFSERPSTGGVLSSSYSVWDLPDSLGNKTYFNWTPYDHFEGTKAYELTTNGAHYSEWGFESYTPESLTVYAAGKLHVALMGNTPEIGIGMASGDSADTLFVKATDYGYVADGKWHEVWIPLSTWASKVDFTAVTMLVGFKCPAVPGGAYVVGSTYTVDDIYITKN